MLRSALDRSINSALEALPRIRFFLVNLAMRCVFHVAIPHQSAAA